MVNETMTPAVQAQDWQPPWMPILMYHRVVPGITAKDPYHLCVTVREFEAQMRFLARQGYRAIALEELARPEPATGKRSHEKRVVITFDDGYLDVFHNALPILRKYGFPATVFLVADHMAGFNSWDQGKVEQAKLLGQGEIEQMLSSGISFGSHSQTHRALNLLGPEDAWQEIAGSKAWLENALGVEVKTFCYPYGTATPEAKEMVRGAGYAAACGIDRPYHSIFQLSRIDAASCHGTGLLWRMKVSGTYRKVRDHGWVRLLRGTA